MDLKPLAAAPHDAVGLPHDVLAIKTRQLHTAGVVDHYAGHTYSCRGCAPRSQRWSPVVRSPGADRQLGRPRRLALATSHAGQCLAPQLSPQADAADGGEAPTVRHAEPWPRPELRWALTITLLRLEAQADPAARRLCPMAAARGQAAAQLHAAAVAHHRSRRASPAAACCTSAPLPQRQTSSSHLLLWQGLTVPHQLCRSRQ